MIEFQCPGCLNSHAANAAFAGLRACCIVCGATIRVPSRSGSKAELAEEASSAARPGTGTRLGSARLTRSAVPPKPSRASASNRAVSATDTEAENMWEDATESADDPTPVEAKKRPLVPVIAEAGDLDDIEVLPSDSADSAESAEASKKPRPEPELPAIDPKTRRKNLIRLGIAGGLAAIVVLCGIFLFSGDKPKPTPPPRRQDDETAKQPEKPQPTAPVPPPKPPEKKVEPPKVPTVEAPPPHLAGEPLPFAASTLVTERAAAPQVFDKNLESRRIIIQGTLARIERDTLVLGDSAEDARNAIHCEIRKGSLTDLMLQPGQAVVIRGVYSRDLRVFNTEVLRTTSPTDEEFKDRVVEVTGVVQQVQKLGNATERFPTLFLTPPTTDPLISVRCLFRLSESEKVGAVKVGQTVTVRGRCEGRLFRVVRFHDCALANTADQPTPGLVRVAADKFFAAYETDLLPVPRTAPDAVPVLATAEQLTEAFAGDPALAGATYRNKLVQVTGKVLSRNRALNTVLLETGTGHRYQMELVFMPTKYALLREETVMTVRGVCTGVRGSYVHFENCERFDPDLGNATVRTTAEYLPYTPNRELTYDLLITGKSKDNPIYRVVVRPLESDLVRSTPIRSGTFGAASLFGDNTPEPKWLKDLTKQKGTQTSLAQHRFRDDLIESREVPAAPAQPADWWDPVFKIGAKKDETWTSEMSDKRTITYTVMEFHRDEANRQVVEIRRVVKDPKEPGVWEETLITYALGVGEKRRVTMKRHANGKALALLEVKLVDAPATAPPGKEPIDPEKKDRKDGP